jgi:hypothetical protein
MVKVLDERHIGDKVIVLMQDTENNGMRTVTMSKTDLDVYNRNNQTDINILWLKSMAYNK